MRCLQGNKQCFAVVIAAIEILLQMYLRSGVKVDDPLLIPLAEHLAFPLIEVNVRLIQQYQLTDSHSR